MSLFARFTALSLGARSAPCSFLRLSAAAPRASVPRRWWSEKAEQGKEEAASQQEARVEPKQEAAAEQDERAGASDGEDASPLSVELQKVKEERDALKEQALRAMAEAENTRRIAHRDVENARNFGVEKFAKHVIKVNDNLRRALGAVPESELTESNAMLTELHRGVGMTKTLLEKALASQQITEISPLGEVFDPAQHAAMFTVPYDGKQEPNTVCQVLESGYMMRDRVLREAQVAVVKKVKPEELPKNEK